MPRRSVISRAEKLEKKRNDERIRMEKIRQDPEKYALWKEKQKRSYIKKKLKGKIVPVSELNPIQKKLVRQKSRLSSKKHYLKKKQELLMQLDEEEIIECDSDNVFTETNDPLQTLEPSSPRSPITLYHDLQVEPTESLVRITRSAARTQTNCNSDSIHDFAVNTDDDNTSIELGSTSPNDSSSATPRPQSAQSVSSCNSPLYLYNPLSDSQTPKKKKKSPWKHLLRQLRYRSKQHQKKQELKIEELKHQNECYRKHIKRLQKIKKIEACIKSIPKFKTMREPSEPLSQEVSRQNLKTAVETFFEEDENTRLCPGKKEFITRAKVKKQKRYLNDSVLNLHKKFVHENPEHKVSYSFFNKIRPFWAVIPNINIRDTCMCKDHQNMELAVMALKQNKLIKEKTTTEILQALCCDSKSDKCLNKKCNQCKHRSILYQEFDNSNVTHYWMWTKNKKSYVKDGVQKFTLQTIKQKIIAYPKDIITYFEKLLGPYMSHVSNIIAQSKYIKELKANLKPEECFVHCDFSENYSTKYATEIQSFHFGSSRQQITLHTSVIYYINNGKLCSQSFCTLSENLRHDVPAIWEHLQPILKFIEDVAPEVTSLFFLSDSPSAQYRNRSMFYVISKLHWNFPSLRTVTWNYSEKGHGKGAPDGVGGVLKRTADQIVARGTDIPNLESLIKHLKVAVPGVILEVVKEGNIMEKQMLIPTLRPFRGSMGVHQVVWSAEKSNTLAMRRLSCNLENCLDEARECEHGRHIGFYILEAINLQERQSTARHTSCKKNSDSSLKKRSRKNRSSVAKTKKNTSLADLDFSDDDSFWIEMPSTDFEQVTTPTITETVLSSLQQKNESQSSDENYEIFDLPNTSR